MRGRQHIPSSALLPPPPALTARMRGTPLPLPCLAQAETILAEGKADAIFMARELLREQVFCAGARSCPRVCARLSNTSSAITISNANLASASSLLAQALFSAQGRQGAGLRSGRGLPKAVSARSRIEGEECCLHLARLSHATATVGHAALVRMPQKPSAGALAPRPIRA